MEERADIFHKLDELQKRIEHLEGLLDISTKQAKQPQPGQPVHPVTPPPPPVQVVKADEKEKPAVTRLSETVVKHPEIKPDHTIPAPPVPSVKWKTPVKKQPKEKGSIEQAIGQKWMLFIGIAVMLAGGVFFFKYAYDQGWINPTMRCITGTIAAVILLVVGEIAYRKKYLLHAACLFAAGTVWLYYTAWAASPNGRYVNILTTNQAFVCMIAITIIGIFLALRANLISNALITVIGALATPILLSSGENRQVELMSYLAAINIGFLLISGIKKWRPVGDVAFAGTLIIFAGWAERFFNYSPIGRTLFFVWLFWAIFNAYSVIFCNALKRQTVYTAITTIAAIFVIYAAVEGFFISVTAALVQCFIATAAAMIIARWKKLPWLRLVMMIWTQTLWTLSMVLIANEQFRPADYYVMYNIVWAFAILFIADIFFSVFMERTRLKNIEIEIINSIFTIISLTAAVWLLYDHVCILGLEYLIAGMGVIALVTAAVIYKKSAAVLGDIYLVAGITLLSISVPLKFDTTGCTISWIILGGILLGVGKKFSRPILTISPVALLSVSFMHLLYMMESMPEIRHTVCTFNGSELPEYLFVAWAIAAAMIAYSTTVLLIPSKNDGILELGLSIAMLTVGMLSAFGFASSSMQPLDVIGVGLIVTWIVTLLSFAGRRTEYFRLAGLFAAAILSIKWIYDITKLHHGLYGKAGNWFILNQQFITAVLLGTSLLWIYVKNRRFKKQIAESGILGLFPLLGMLLLTLAGGFEVTRYFEGTSQSSSLTLWWTIFSLVLLVIGYRVSKPGCRYPIVVFYSLALLGVAAFKWTILDSLGSQGLYCKTQSNLLPVCNLHFLTGVLIACGMLWANRKTRWEFGEFVSSKGLFVAVQIIALVIITLAGDYEITRFVGIKMGKQMALSLWWSIWATVVLVIGFVISRPGFRYFALALYTATLIKVILVDMEGVDTIYRVLTFVAFGVLLVLGSFLYHKFLREGAKHLPAEKTSDES